MTPPEAASQSRPAIEGHIAGLWMLGLIRVAVLLVAASGALLVGEAGRAEAPYLAAFYVFGVISSIVHVFALRRSPGETPTMTWLQVLIDFAVVAATVSFTGGSESLFSFLFVIVILEAGVLLGLAQALGVASAATGVMLIFAVQAPPPTFVLNADNSLVSHNVLSLWYGFLIQTLAYFLTASISGYWNVRLRRMQQFQREILDNMNNGFLITDNKGIVLLESMAAERILNLEPGEAIGQPVQDVMRVPPGQECPVVIALRMDRDFTRYEYTAVIKPNTLKLLGLSTSRMFDWRKRKIGMIVSFSDLTELERMREEIKRQDRLSATGELAAGLAHEIRNPVAAIRGAVAELETSLDQPEVARKLTAIAVRESDQLNAIITSVLDFAREPKPRRDAFDVRGVAEEAAESVRRKSNEVSELNVVTKFPQQVCGVSGDRSQIRQVFINLAKNAVEAMEEKGTLTISITPGPAYVEIRFDDEGPGIDPDKVARIFEPFYTTKESGVGMGLAICLRIVTSHDGTLRAASRKGGGTSMSVRLPLARAGG